MFRDRTGSDLNTLRHGQPLCFNEWRVRCHEDPVIQGVEREQDLMNRAWNMIHGRRLMRGWLVKQRRYKVEKRG